MKNNSFQGNAAQVLAISHGKGPAMVLAGPGSGKTFVIVERVKYLIEERKVTPSSILVITFTKAAALEMQHRFMKITDSSYPDVSFGTFHSFFYQIIRWAGPKSKTDNIKIATEGFKLKVMRDIMLSVCESKEIIAEIEYGDDIVRDALSEISRIKNSGITCNECEKSLVFAKDFPRIYESYQKRLKEFGMIDFDDMIILCYEILCENREILSKLRERFKYFLIDEYQDINKMQFMVINLLMAGEENLFVVGDDDQSIYGFRGSDPGIMLEFTDHFKEYNPKRIDLNINYRCGKAILDNALNVIKENSIRFNKKLVASDTNGKGKIMPLLYSSNEAQASAIALFLNNNPDNLSDIAIICRTNLQCMNIAEKLKESGIETNLSKVVTSFAEDEGVLLIMDYLNFAYLGQTRELFYRIMNKPLRYISREAVPEQVVKAEAIKSYYRNNKRMKNEVDRLFKHINMISHVRPSLAVRYLRKEVGIDKLYPGSKDKIDELENIARTHSDMRKFLEEIREMKELSKDEKKEVNKLKGNCVKLMTMHGSKGLEYNTVWIPSLNEGIIPARGAMTISQIEEERRMLYVAMTRAKKLLIMSYIKGTQDNPMFPTRFLRPVKYLWDEKYQASPSRPSSGSSISSSNSTSSR